MSAHVADRSAVSDESADLEIDGPLEIERAILNETEHGRAIASGFVFMFGDFVSSQVRPVLREVAEAGEEPQLLVNGLAELLRQIAESIEFPIGTSR